MLCIYISPAGNMLSPWTMVVNCFDYLFIQWCNEPISLWLIYDVDVLNYCLSSVFRDHFLNPYDILYIFNELWIHTQYDISVCRHLALEYTKLDSSVLYYFPYNWTPPMICSFMCPGCIRQLFPSVSPHVCQKEHIVVFLKRLDCHQLPLTLYTTWILNISCWWQCTLHLSIY